MLAKVKTWPNRDSWWSFQQRLLNLKLRRFSPKVCFEIDANSYVVKTASTAEELKQVLRLRHEIFVREGLGESRIMGVDFDRYDLLGDHILLIKKDTNQVIGSYRIMCSHFTRDFYSANEFYLDDLVQADGVKMELGRACIHQDHRNGAAIHLVWKGLGKYASLIGADYMFGCASVQSVDCNVAKSIYEYLLDGNYSETFNIAPRGTYLYPQWDEVVPMLSVDSIENGIPSLMKSYLKAGAKIHSVPAYDKKFRCSDFLTILKMSEINPKYQRKYIEAK